MHALRNARHLARLVLAWLALAVFAAAASPLAQGTAGEWVCSGGQMKLLLPDGAPEGAGPQTLDCPLCLVQDAPPPARAPSVPHAQPLGLAVQTLAAARVAGLTAAPPPARGPPAPL